jgi:hypothetical protein
MLAGKMQNHVAKKRSANHMDKVDGQLKLVAVGFVFSSFHNLTIFREGKNYFETQI